MYKVSERLENDFAKQNDHKRDDRECAAQVRKSATPPGKG
jgi:hypothetical protein